MKVSELYYFPIKSLPGIAKQSVEIVATGVENDRKWMLVDENGEFITLRKQRNMTQFSLRESQNYLHIYSKILNDEIHLPWKHERLSSLLCEIWDDKTICNLVGKAYDDFFTEHLKKRVRLVCLDDHFNREKLLRKEPFKTNLSFVDGYPITFLSKSSLEFLNDQLSEEIDIRQFRINIILEGGNAFDEDTMQHFRIKKTHYSMVKEIRRCIVINMNPDTGELSKEPLRYLSKNRTIDKKVIFGMNAVVLKTGQIQVGDTVELI